MGIFSWIGKTGLKLAVVGSVIKVSADNNVWSLQTEEGENVYDKIRHNILPGSIVYREKMPSPNELQCEVGSHWNENVKRAFNWLNAAPSKLNHKFNSLYRSSS